MNQYCDAGFAAARLRLRANQVAVRCVQYLAWCGALMLIVWAFSDQRFRDGERSLEGGFCFPFVAGIALIVLACTVAGGARSFGSWFALALVGQAASLQMIEAGQLIHYQHYKTFSRLLTENPVSLGCVAFQSALVLFGLRARWSRIRRWTVQNFRYWQLISVGLLCFLSGAAVSREIPAYIAELCVAAVVQTVSLGNILLVVCSLPERVISKLRQQTEKFFGVVGAAENRNVIVPSPEDSIANDSGQPGLDRFVLFAAFWVTLIAALLSFFVYEKYPHVQDEVMYLYQARYFADWKLTVQAPPVPDAFTLYMIPYHSPRWYSIFPPGWPAVLALGVVLGVPWLVNPLLAGLNLLLAYIFIQELYDRHIARISVLLLCSSPWYVFMAMNFMAHTFTLTAALAAALGIVYARKSGKAIWGLVSGSAVGVVSLIRPLDGLIMAGLVAVWAIGIGGKRLKALCVVTFALGTAAVGAVVLPYNKAITGDSTLFPLTAYYEEYFGPKSNALGFGPERGLGWSIDAFPGHSPIESAINASLNIFSLNIELFGWSTGSLVLVGLLLFSRNLCKSDWAMLTVIAAVVGVYSLYWFSGGPDFGARYWYLVLFPLVCMTARGVNILATRVAHLADYRSDQAVLPIIVLVLLCASSLINYFPWRAADKYHHYLRMRPDLSYLSKEYNFGKSLILVREREVPDYTSAWVFNPLDPYAPAPVYAWDRNPQVRARLLKAYSDRPAWLVNGPTVTGAGFKVVAGPSSSHQLSDSFPR